MKLFISSMCLLFLTAKGQVADGGTIRPLYLYVGDNTSTTRDGEITCMQENADGDRLYGGKLTEASVASPNLAGVSAFIGLKKAGVHAFDDPTAWQWAVYYTVSSYAQIDFCYWTPSAIGAPYNKQLFVFTQSQPATHTRIKYFMNDPADATTGTYKKLFQGLPTYQYSVSNRDQYANYHFESNVLLFQDSSTVTREVFVGYYSIPTYFSYFTKLINWSAKSAYEYFTIWDNRAGALEGDSSYSIVIIRANNQIVIGATTNFVPGNTNSPKILNQCFIKFPDTMDFRANADSSSAQMISRKCFVESPFDTTSTRTLAIQKMQYFDKLVVLLGDFYQTYNDPGKFTKTTFGFMGECSPDNWVYGEFDTLSVVEKKGIGFYAKDTKTNYAFFRTRQYFPKGGSDIYYQMMVVKINFDPDPANCATKGMLSPFTAKAYWPTDVCPKFSSCRINEVRWNAGASAFIYIGAIKKFKWQEKQTKYFGFANQISEATINTGATIDYALLASSPRNDIVDKTGSKKLFRNDYDQYNKAVDAEDNPGIELPKPLATMKTIAVNQCQNKLILNTAEFIEGYIKILYWNTYNTTAQTHDILYNDIFGLVNPPAACTMTCAAYKSSGDIVANPQLRVPELYDTTFTNAELTFGATAITAKAGSEYEVKDFAILCDNTVDFTWSHNLDIKVEKHPCNSQPITVTAATKVYRYDVYTDWEGTETNQPVDDQFIMLNPAANPIVAAPGAYQYKCNITKIENFQLKTAAGVVVDPTLYASKIKLDTLTSPFKFKITDWTGMVPADWLNTQLWFTADTDYAGLAATKAVTLTIDKAVCNYATIANATTLKTQMFNVQYETYVPLFGDWVHPKNTSLTAIEEEIKDITHFVTSDPTCPIIDFHFSRVLFKNDTVMPPELYKDVFTFDNDTHKIKIQNWSGLSPLVFNETKLMFKAKTLHVLSPEVNIFSFNLTQTFKYQPKITDPPYFVEPVLDIDVAYDFVTPGVNKKIIKYKFPEMKSKNPEANILPITITGIKDSYTFLSFEGDTLTINPNLITARQVTKLSKLELTVHTHDDSGLKGDFALNIKIKHIPPPPVVVPKPTPPPVKPPPPPPPELPKNVRPLVSFVSDFDSLGLITMKFNQPLVQNTLRRRLQKLDPTELFDLSIELGDFEGAETFDKSKLEFTWDVVGSSDIRGKEFYQFQVNFTSAAQVSAHSDPDRIVIKFKDSSLFKSDEGAFIKKVMKSKVPKQMPNSDASRSFDTGTSSVGQVLNYTVLVCAGINFLFAGVLMKIVGSLLQVQIVIFEALMMFLLPGNAVNYIQKIRPIVTFNIVRFLTDFSIYLMPIDKDEQLKNEEKVSTPMKSIGIKNFIVLVNLGNFFWLLMLYGYDIAKVVWYQIQALNHAWTPKEEFYKEKAIKAFRPLQWQPLLQICVSGFVPISIALYLGFSMPLFTTAGEIFGFIFAIIYALLEYVFLPYCFYKIMSATKSQLLDPEFKRKYGFLYGNVKTDTILQRAWRLIFIFRRFFIIFVSVVFKEVPVWQILSIVFMNYFLIFYSAFVKPFKTTRENKLDLYNEGLVQAITIHFFMFSDAMPDPVAQYTVGWSIAVFLSCMLLLNTSSVIYTEIIRKTYLIFVKKYNKWQIYRGKRNKVIVLHPRKKVVIVESSSDSDSSSEEKSIRESTPQQGSSSQSSRMLLKKQGELSVIKEDYMNETALGEKTFENQTPDRKKERNPQDIENQLKAEDEILKEVMNNDDRKKEEEELLKEVNNMNQQQSQSGKSSTLSKKKK